VANVPKAPVSNSLALKNPDGGEAAGAEDVIGCPPKAAIPREVNITMAKAVSLFIFAFLHPRCCGSTDWINIRCKGLLQGTRVKVRLRRLRPNRACCVALPSNVNPQGTGDRCRTYQELARGALPRSKTEAGTIYSWGLAS
jgi:hypothetical protein